MTLNLARIIGGYLRTSRLRSFQRQAVQEGKPAEQREFVAYNASCIPCPFILPRRDIVSVKHLITLNIEYKKLQDDLLGKIDEWQSKRPREVSHGSTVFLPGLCDEDESRRDLRELLSELIGPFREKVLLETGFNPEDFPPYILKAFNRVNLGPVLDRLRRVRDIDSKYVLDVMFVLCKPFVESLKKYILHFVQSNDPVDLFNAQLLLYYPLHPELPKEPCIDKEFRDSIEQIINRKLPCLEINPNESLMLGTLPARIGETVWVVKLHDVDPTYSKRISTAEGSDKIVICTKSINSPKERVYGSLSLPAQNDVKVHLASPYSQVTRDAAVLRTSLMPTDQGVAWLDMANERRLQDHLALISENIDSDNPIKVFGAQKAFYQALDEGKLVLGGKIKTYDHKPEEYQRMIEALGIKVEQSANAAKDALNNATSASPITIPDGEVFQIAPYTWIQLTKNLRSGDFSIEVLYPRRSADWTPIRATNLLLMQNGSVYCPNNKIAYERVLPAQYSWETVVARKNNGGVSFYRAPDLDAKAYYESLCGQKRPHYQRRDDDTEFIP